MKIIQTKLPGLVILEPEVFEDSRGYFFETYNAKTLEEHGIMEKFVQSNTSHSRKGTLRGLHYQLDPFAQGKLVWVPHGEIFDVVVDIRKNSPTYGQWFGTTLSSENKHAIYIPPGFAHGYCAVKDSTIIYKCTNYYSPAHARDIAWNDPTINIAWPIVPNQELISDKDKKAASLATAENCFFFDGTPKIKNQAMTINTHCRACQSPKLTKVIDLGMQPLANGFLKKENLDKNEATFPLEVYFCENCSHTQLIHIVDKEILFRDYVYFSSVMPEIAAYWRSYAQDVINRFLKTTNDLVVELGSNDGVMLKFFKEEGYRITGVDPAINIAKIANERGIETIAEFFNETIAKTIVTKKGQAKAIIGNNVIAHIDDYETLGHGLHKLLALDGVFVFEAPYLMDMFQNLTFDTIYHEHMSYLAVRPMNAWLNRFGMEIFEVQIVPSQGQSIRVFAGHIGQHAIAASVAELSKKEIEMGLDKKETYIALDKKIAQCKTQALEVIKKLKAEGKSIVIYGAPAKGNTLLNYYGFGTNFFDFCLDYTPSKQGLYTPGTHIPIFDKSYLDSHQPDYYFLLAWNYAKIILEKEKNFLANGGAFIMPNGKIIRQSTNSTSQQKITEAVNQQQDTKKILVCGGAGFIGSNFIHHLYNKYPNYHIVNLDALTYCGNLANVQSIAEKNDGRYTFVRGDICDPVLLNKLMDEHRFDAVVNFAAESHVDRSLQSSEDFVRTNVVGVRNLLDTARAFNVPRFVQISTDEVYGDVLEATSEDAPLKPSSPYAASKAAADLLIKSYIHSHNFPGLIVRGSNNFGPRQYPEKLIPLAISNFLEKKKVPVYGDGQNVRSWLYVGDFANAIDLVMHHGKLGHTYNVSGAPKKNIEILESIANNLKINQWRNELSAVTDRPGHDRKYKPDATKIMIELGWQPVFNFDDAMRQTVNWYLTEQQWWMEVKNKQIFKEYYDKQYNVPRH